MDPDATLQAVRELVATVGSGEFDKSQAIVLAMAVADLDAWMSEGGFLPGAWIEDAW